MKKTLHLLIIALMTINLCSCGENPAETPSGNTTVEVSTKAVTQITAITAVCGGKITSEGSSEIKSRGVCWATSAAPTTADAKTMDGSGVGEFSSTLTNLTKGTTYYIRAYAVTATTTVYGKAVSFTAGALTPTVTTAAVSAVEYKTAIGGGTVVDAGVSEVIDCGICWSKTENPTTENDNVMGDPAEDTFSLPMENLESGTIYYVRAFAVSEAGTGYGEQVQFSTKEESLITLADPNFMQYCLDNFDLNFDGKLQASEALEVKNIECSKKNIASLAGLDQFPLLEVLSANDNPLVSLDLSKNKALTVVGLIRTSLETITVTDMPLLETLLCDGLKEEQVGVLKTLTVSNCSQLKEIFCQENSLNKLTVTGCPELFKLCVFRNLLTAIDLTSCEKLSVLEAWDNQLTALDVSRNKALTELKITRNNITSLSVTDMPELSHILCDGLRVVDGVEKMGTIADLTVRNCPLLTELFCQENSIESLTVSDCPALEKVCAWRNKLSTLSLSGLKGLKTVQVAANRLTSLDLADCASLDVLDAPDNQLTTLILSGCTNLREVWIQNNRMLTAVDLSAARVLQQLRCMNSGILSLDLNNKGALTSVWCDGCGMQSIKVDGCTSLAELKCQNNNLASVNVKGCTSLRAFWCDNNFLSSIDLSGCSALTECNLQINRALISLNVTGCSKLANLQAWDCALTNVDFSTCQALEFVQMNDNQLTSLAVHGTKLHDVHCVRNKITSFTITNAPLLTTIWIHDNLLETMDVSECAMAMNCLGIFQPGEPVNHTNPLKTLYVKTGQTFNEKFVPETAQTILK